MSASSDLLWELTRTNSSFLVKRRSGAGVQFSKEPLNVTGNHTYSQSGLVNERALGLTRLTDGSIQLSSRVAKNSNKPSKSISVTTFKPFKSQRKIALAVSKAAAGYREDLRTAAVIKASTLARISKPKKAQQPKKVRGKKSIL